MQNILLKRNFIDPLRKDTISIPQRSIIAVRFIANNPGYWMIRDMGSKGWTRGLDIVLQVGENYESISPPNDFPKCGNWIGPDFFLI